MALRIVRAEGEDAVVRPLRLWYSGRHAEALAALVAPEEDSSLDELGQLVELALAHDLGHARRLGDALVSWSDEAEAYRLLKRSCERLLDDLKPLGPDVWMSSAIAIVELTQAWLARQPHEPILMNYVGVAVYGLNEPSLAVKLFEAVQRLDPGTENVRGNLNAARGRLRKPVRVPLRTPVALALRGLRPHLERLAARARTRPAAGRVSLCMIVRDEEEMLAACLESCREAVSEMVIVDTGSSDRTVEIAESFGARVVHFAWSGSFAEARNVGIDAATGDWILWLDADEQLEPGDDARLAELTRQPWREAHWLVETNYTGQQEAGTASQHCPAALAEPRPLPLLGRDPRADPELDGVRPDRALRSADAQDPPLRLPQGAHRRARQAPAQPRAAAGRARGQPAGSLHALQHRHRVRRHGRHAGRAAPLRAGARAAARRARLVGARLRADPRLAPVRRAAHDRRSRGLRGPGGRGARVLPRLHRPGLRARARRPGPRRSRGSREALHALSRDGQRAPALLGRRRSRDRSWRSARSRSSPPISGCPRRPRAGSSARSSCTPSTSRPGSISRACC